MKGNPTQGGNRHPGKHPGDGSTAGMGSRPEKPRIGAGKGRKEERKKDEVI